MLCAGVKTAVAQAIPLLEQGGVVAFPTDTIYGLGADVFNPHAVGKVFRAKGRPFNQGIPILLGSARGLDLVARNVSEVAWSLAERFWPGPLTLILWKSTRVPEVVTGGSDTVAVRVPFHDVPATIIRELGAPLTGTSANRSGGSNPVTAEDVRQQLGDSIDLIIDGGACPGGQASTIVDLTAGRPTVVRRGALPLGPLRSASPVPIHVAESARW